MTSRDATNALKWTDERPHRGRLRQTAQGVLASTIFSNTSWLLLERVFSLAVRLAVGAWIVRYLGPEHYGVYTYAVSFVALFSALATLGLDTLTVRRIVQGQEATGRLLATVFSLRLATGLVTLAVIGAVLFAAPYDPLTRLAVLLAAGQLLFQPAEVFDLWFQAHVRSKYTVWVRTLVMLVISGSQVAFILSGVALPGFLLLLLLQSALTAAGLFLSFKILRREPMDWHPDWSIARKMLREAWPLIFASVSVSVYMRIDQVMLGHMAGNAEAGVYGAAVRLSELWYFIPAAIASSVFPGIVRLREEGTPEAYARRLQVFYDGMVVQSYAIILPMTLLAGPVVRLLFGEAYAASAPILQVHVWTILFVSLGIARSQWLVVQDLAVFTLFTTILGAATNVGLNLLLIPHFAGLGAAWATLVSQAVAAYFSCALYRETRSAFVLMSKSIALVPRLLQETRKTR